MKRLEEIKQRMALLEDVNNVEYMTALDTVLHHDLPWLISICCIQHWVRDFEHS